MSSGEVKQVSCEDLQLVQTLIERCLQLYMSQNEVINTLVEQAKIEPGFTELVWLKLEEQNQEFFKAYYLRLMVKDQIMQFNGLLERQVELMRQIYPQGMASILACNGSHIPSFHQNSATYVRDHVGPALKANSIHRPLDSCLHNTVHNGGQCAINAHSQRIDLPPDMLAQNPTTGMLQGMNGGMVKSESPYMFGNDGNVLESHTAIGDAAVMSFSSVESNPNPLNGTLVDAGGGSIGLWGHIPWNFSLSDSSADFPNTSGTLNSYPSLADVTDEELDHHGGGDKGDDELLDMIPDDFGFEDFGSDRSDYCPAL